MATQPEVLFDRAALEQLAAGRISGLFGPLFAAQDGHRRQVRMPQPPLLLADRVIRLTGEAASMGSGSVTTETDVTADSWYLDPAGRMPAGVMVEAGQADLLLVSWLGADLVTGGDRVYRLLGCEVTYHGQLPAPGETLRYDIHIDGHSEVDGVRLFSFRYHCAVAGTPRLTVRDGQVGFFTDAELADTAGVLWEPPPRPPAARGRSFSAEQVAASYAERPLDCFGPGWERTGTHVRTPRPGTGRLRLLTEVPEFDPTGYLRASTPVTPQDWFFASHFKNDPCMPGTLMLEGALQAMAFYLAAAGHTVHRDGWRFEPVPEVPFTLSCRGQVTPESSSLTYEVYVSDLVEGPEPTLAADVLCRVDGVKAFLVRGAALRLVPDWPLEQWRQQQPAVQRTGALVPPATLAGLRGYVERRPVAEYDGFRYDYASLLACAWTDRARRSDPVTPSWTG